MFSDACWKVNYLFNVVEVCYSLEFSKVLRYCPGIFLGLRKRANGKAFFFSNRHTSENSLNEKTFRNVYFLAAKEWNPFTSQLLYLNNGLFQYNKDALSVLTNSGKHSVVRLLMRLKYKDGQKTHYASRWTTFQYCVVQDVFQRKVRPDA